MPHVDDGTLHALLDGALKAEDPAGARAAEAHLEGCADCRARLDAAAESRRRAGQILGAVGAVGAGAPGDFEEVIARAAALSGDTVVPAPGHPGSHGPDSALARRASRARRTRATAWAATVILALGTGYLIRDQLVTEQPATDAVSIPAVDADRVASREAPAVAGDALESAAPASPEPPTAEPPSGERPPADPPAAVAAPAPPVAEATAPTQAPPPVAAPPAVAFHQAEPIGRPADLAATDRPPAAATRAEDLRVATPVTVAPGAAAARAQTAGAIGYRPDGRPAPVALDAVVVTGSVWQPTTPAEAVALMDGVVYTLRGAELVEVMTRGSGEDVELRTVQRLEDGATVVVTQVRAGSPLSGGAQPAPPRRAAEAAELAETGARIRVLRDDHWLTVVGTLPAEVLRALALEAERLQRPF